MDFDDILPPLPLEPPDDFGLDQGRAPPPPPLQTSSDAEVMDVSSGGDGYTSTPGEGEDATQQPVSEGLISFCSHLSDEVTSSNPPCPRTARHAPPVTKFLPDLKLLRDVKISVSFTEGSSSTSNNTSSKDRQVLYTGEGQEAGNHGDLGSYELHDPSSILEEVEGSCGAGNSTGRKFDEADVDLENKVEFAVLDELEDFYENLLDQDDEHGGFKSGALAQHEHVDDEAISFAYEVRENFCLQDPVVSVSCKSLLFFQKHRPPTTVHVLFLTWSWSYKAVPIISAQI